jgi:DNA helicase-2/ATP-dependent DNA helicase PcrA
VASIPTAEQYRQLKRAALEQSFAHLNPAQRQAVFQINGPVLILAGAGSGKTTVLINRIAYMLRYGNAYHSRCEPPRLSEEDLRFLRAAATGAERDDERLAALIADNPPYPYRILAITFTNKAADELKERLSSMLGAEIAADIAASTFHSACVRILRAEAHLLGYPRSFGIYDSDDSQRLIKEILRDFNLDDKVYPPRTMANAIGAAKDALYTPEQLLAEADGHPRKEQIARIYGEYQRRLMTSGAMDFDDLITNTVRLFQSHPDVLEKYQRRFRYIMVDEYQDTNRAQYALVSLLADAHGNLCVVGDDDQSIYRFRGATIENILGFERQFEGAMVVRLEQNYRSTQIILDAANHLISHNTERKGKTLFTEQVGGELIMLKAAADEMAEAGYIAEVVEAAVRQGGRYADHAVLYRMNAQSGSVEQVFINAGIPYRIVGGLRFYERKEIKDLLAYLSVIENPADALRLKRIINEPKRGIGDATVATASEVAQTLGISLYEVIASADQFAPLSRRARSLMDFARMMETLRQAADSLPLPALLDTLLAESGYIDHILADKQSAMTRMENIGELKNTMARYADSTDQPTLSGFLEEVALYTAMDTYDAAADAVVMMTLHSAKGLEFESVYIIGMEEGIFPGNQAIVAPDEIEEERRLCYVGFTRAKKRLHLLRARQRMMFGQTMRNRPSRFIGEVPAQLIEDLSTEPAEFFGGWQPQRPAPSRFTGSRPATAQKPESFMPGDAVIHRVFGRGTVLSATDMGGDILYEIAFDKVGTKKVMATFARLQRA